MNYRVKMNWLNWAIYWYLNIASAGATQRELLRGLDDIQFKGYYPADYVYKVKFNLKEFKIEIE